MNILKKYIKEQIIKIGDDELELDTPTFEIISVNINTAERTLSVGVLYTATQGSVNQKHHRSYEVGFQNLPTDVKATGKSFLDAIELELLKLPQHDGASETT